MCIRDRDMPTGAVTNPYGRTKYIIEEILKDVCVSDPCLLYTSRCV